MLCKTCEKLGFAEKQSACKTCKGTVQFNLYKICAQCSERKKICAVCMKKMTRAVLPPNPANGCPSCGG